MTVVPSAWIMKGLLVVYGVLTILGWFVEHRFWFGLYWISAAGITLSLLKGMK